MKYEHKPVMLDEVVTALNIRAEGYYIDGTFGRGGHSRAILKKLSSKGRIIAFDKDPKAIENVDYDLKNDPRLELVHGSFSMLMQYAIKKNIKGRIAGILFDLGVSSPQLDDASRGFSFRFDAPLDMRMNTDQGQTVTNWLKTASEKDIADVIYEYGEERASRKIARAIVSARKKEAITNTIQLANIVAKVSFSRKNRIHPATKTFQALRIFINNELDEIENALPQTIDVLDVNGRLAVISFHSLEDRIVKRFMLKESRDDNGLSMMPYSPPRKLAKLKLIAKKLRASKEDIKTNPRCRSALLRVAERCI